MAATRRTLLGSMMGAGALLGMNAGVAAASETDSASSAAAGLLEMARLRSYKPLRSSSWDRTGANADAVPVAPGQSATLLDVHGAGVVTHIWFTIDSRDPHHLK
ncbi:MAG TPA: hypothetical protein VMD29_10555, partial [Terracidiphilus sp.]|nr:hypothetical protein [Terracidiphilus sp.]